MLSRVASNIYWMGRYLERAEHLARYTRVQYFSIYDAPHLQDINFILGSIVNMTGIDYDLKQSTFNEEEIILKVGLERDSNVSIFACIYSARENARSSRNRLSDELWQSINEYYRYVQDYDSEYFKSKGLFEFTQEINKYSNLIKSILNQTLLHEFGWLLITLGIYLERSIQVIRTVKSKLVDISILNMDRENKALEDYQWTTALKIVEAFDIYRRNNKHWPQSMTPMEFMIFHKTFPRSILYSLNKVNEMIGRISAIEKGNEELTFYAERLFSKIRFTRSEDLTDVNDFMDELIEEVQQIHGLLDQNIFGVRSKEKGLSVTQDAGAQ